MASTPESKVKQRAVKLLKAYGVYYFFPATHGFGRSGVPDIICCIRGRFVAIECKANGNKPTALQEREMANIRAAGGITFVIDEAGFDLLEIALKELTHGNQTQANP
jgi:Holliday junction resolvase